MTTKESITETIRTVCEALKKARASLSSGMIGSEYHTRSAVIDPILESFGWDRTDPFQWIPEYSVPSGKVDDALFAQDGSPRVFVEAKKPGGLSAKAEEQLFDYAQRQGVPILILTDGDVWDLYASMAGGEPAKRRFLHAQITKCDNPELEELAGLLYKFVGRDQVLSGAAGFAAGEKLQSDITRAIGRDGLAGAWKHILKEEDLLRDLLSDTVNEQIGVRPHPDDVNAFLADRPFLTDFQGPTESPSQKAAKKPRNPKTPKSAARNGRKAQGGGKAAGKITGVTVAGTHHVAPSGSKALALLAGILESRSEGVLAIMREQSKDRMWPAAVQPGDDALSHKDAAMRYTEVSGSGNWQVYTKLSSPGILRRMQQMAGAAGLKWERDVSVTFKS